MSTNPEKAVAYVLSKSVTEYMDKDVLMLDLKTLTREAATMLRNYETDDIVVIDSKKFPVGIVTDEDISATGKNIELNQTVFNHAFLCFSLIFSKFSYSIFSRLKS